MLAGILLGIVVLVSNGLLMAVSGWFIASMGVAGSTGLTFNYFMPAAAIRGLALIRTFGRYAERLVTHEAALRVVSDLRVWLLARCEPLAPAVLERYAGGDLAGRLRADLDSLENVYLRILAPLAAGLTTILFGAGCLFWWSRPAAGAAALALFTVGVLLPLASYRLCREPGERSAHLAGELRREVTDGLEGMEELILLGAAARQAERAEMTSRALIDEQLRLARIQAAVASCTTACAGAALSAILILAGGQVSAGQLPGPVLVMLLLLVTALFEAASLLPVALQQVPAAREAACRVLTLARHPHPVTEPDHPATLPSGTAIRLRGAVCSREGAAPLPLPDLEIPAGSSLALVGPSGSGKSSVIDVLLRFREYGGIVQVGETELRDLPGDDLRRLITALPQQPHLFDATLRDNLLLAHPHADREELHRAIADAGLEAWVAQLPLGLDTPLGEGGSLVSGGEARRIALARALLKDAPIVLLDEPTEGLDPDAEVELVRRLKRRLQGRTVLTATHRPACQALADRVVQMNQDTVEVKGQLKGSL